MPVDRVLTQNKLRAMSALLNPCATSFNTSPSRGVNAVTASPDAATKCGAPASAKAR